MSTTRPKQSPLSDFFSGFASFFRGMWVTVWNLVVREKITVQYPYEKLTVSPRYRGLFYLPYNEETHRLNCTGCTLCVPCKTRRRTGLLAAIRGVFGARSRRAPMLESGRFGARAGAGFSCFSRGRWAAPSRRCCRRKLALELKSDWASMSCFSPMRNSWLP